MNKPSEGLFSLAAKVRTPLTLAGVAFVILYKLYDRVLSLNIFSALGESGTRAVIEKLLDKVFVLAIIALCLGVVSYLLTFFFKPKSAPLKSDVHLLDASLDSTSREYTEEIAGRVHSVRPRNTKSRKDSQ
jgi:hypothetical protein